VHDVGERWVIKIRFGWLELAAAYTGTWQWTIRAADGSSARIPLYTSSSCTEPECGVTRIRTVLDGSPGHGYVAVSERGKQGKMPQTESARQKCASSGSGRLVKSGAAGIPVFHALHRRANGTT